ncbi:hypothetical protein R3P38DRAFT_3235904 [Favolaschia claudopus]|uniref:Uncharacterized protein n=1 Tax=Favolaschia claudopus TaxID=2862362 RepID=A0AAV9ZEF4_9AGAR
MVKLLNLTIFLVSIVSALATPLSTRDILKCSDPACGGNLLENNIEIWDGYLREIAEQIGIDPNQPDLYHAVVKAGAGMCIKTPESNVPSDA